MVNGLIPLRTRFLVLDEYISVDLDSENINEILDNLAQDEFEDLVDASNLLETSEEAADCERHPEVLRKDIFVTILAAFI